MNVEMSLTQKSIFHFFLCLHLFPTSFFVLNIIAKITPVFKCVDLAGFSNPV